MATDMMDAEASPFIERRFELLDKEVVLHFNRPFLAPTRDYRCDWSIEWPDRDEASSAYGIDAIQALLLAMRSAHSRLKFSEEYRSGQLKYLGSRELDLPSAFD